MIPGHKQLANWNDYAFDCPEGAWTGRLEQLAWGKSTNLILCFADVATGQQYRLSVLSGTRYKPRDGSHDFKNDAAPGDVFELNDQENQDRQSRPEIRPQDHMNFDTAADELRRREFTRLADAVTPRPEQLRSMTPGELRTENAMMWERLGHTLVTGPDAPRAGDDQRRAEIHHHVRQSGRPRPDRQQRLAPLA